MGGLGGAEEGLSPASLATPDTEEPARRLFHSEEHETGLNLPILRSQVSYYRPPLPYPRPAAQPLHSLLLLPPRSGAGTDGHAGRQLLPFSHHLLLERSQLHRKRTEPARHLLPQKRQCIPA